ncbi:double zinc ribbon domain-containing protein [Acetobacter conturbans]|uniref:ComF family protein n=1 Tax=Acetobacter conturbans TaxID=1737472 RepID=A0ABX0K0C7_9PROT|nr:double zinc ribbon domain-containing protein [Acetobacter conturbans]NHN87487.1 ComF family protein [Acetobacter conturbans]
MILPPTCAVCGTEVDQPRSLCPACFMRMHPIGDPRCDQCGVPLPSAAHLGRDARCVSCELHHPAWSKGRAAYVYDTGSRDLILALKYADRTQNAAVLARQMARAGSDILETADWLIPVPVHWRRLMERKYNQAALLARAVGKLAGVPVLVDALQRPHATSRLAGFSAVERAREMEDAIRVRAARAALLRGRNVVLVDDILTTGATATACTKMLLAAGAASVSLLAAARTAPDANDDISRPDTEED